MCSGNDLYWVRLLVDQSDDAGNITRIERTYLVDSNEALTELLRRNGEGYSITEWRLIVPESYESIMANIEATKQWAKRSAGNAE